MTLKFVVCGLEHTGTTLVTELFRQVPKLDSGFECGVLMQDTPRNFVDMQPFAKHMLNGWGITQEQFEACCETDSHAEFYERLMQASTKLAEDTSEIFDKTPRYLTELGNVLDRSEVPAVVTHKDPRAIVCSDYKRAAPDDFDAWMDDYAPKKINYMRTAYDQHINHLEDDRVVFVGLETLAMNARPTMEDMFSHVGKEFELGYAVMSGVKFANVRSNAVSADIVFEYRKKLTTSQLQRIEDEFSYFDLWYYS